MLISRSLEIARAAGFDGIVIFGHPANYAGRGFKSCAKYNVSAQDGSFPSAMLVKELKDAFFDGRPCRFIESAAYQSDMAGFAAFDAAFEQPAPEELPHQEEFWIYSRSCVESSRQEAAPESCTDAGLKAGIVCAGDDELAPFLPHIEKRTERKEALLTVHEGIIGSIKVCALFSGVCRVNAAIATQILVDRFGCNLIVNAGTCGALDSRLEAGDTVVFEQVRYHDVADGLLTDFHPWFSSEWLCADPKLLDAAREAARNFGRRVFFGKTVTGESFIAGAEREQIIGKFRPLSVDMESAAIAHVCRVNGVPFISVRTVTDSAAAGSADDFEANCRASSQIAKNFTLSLLNKIALSFYASKSSDLKLL